MDIIYQILGWIFMAYIWALYALLAFMAIGGILMIIKGIVWLVNKAADMDR